MIATSCTAVQNQRRGAHGQNIKVVLFTWLFAHYRAPIFRRLSQHPHLDFAVCAGDNTTVGQGAKVASAGEVGKADGINWRHLASHRLTGPFLKDFEWQPEAVKIAWKENLDVVMSVGYQSISNILVRIICRLRGIPVIEWTQGIRRKEQGIRWFVRKMYFKWASAFLFYGESAREFFSRNGFNPEQLFVVYNSLDYDLQVAIRQKVTTKNIEKCRREFGVVQQQDRLIFSSCRFEKWKQLHLLIEALAVLKQRGHNVRCVLIGDGREKEHLQLLARQRGIDDRVIFYGECYDEEKIGLIISSSDLCVVPGDVGLVAMHSLVYGTPLLTCDNTRGIHGPEIETIVEGKTGGYFREGDMDDLAAKIDKMLYPVPCKKQMEQACKSEIDKHYNPRYQEHVILEAINYVLSKSSRYQRKIRRCRCWQ